jgi:tetratricopeptide (TPR) repeat protein
VTGVQTCALPISFIDKGDAYKKMGNTDKAMECYDKALKLVKKSFYGE